MENAWKTAAFPFWLGFEEEYSNEWGNEESVPQETGFRDLTLRILPCSYAVFGVKGHDSITRCIERTAAKSRGQAGKKSICPGAAAVG